MKDFQQKVLHGIIWTALQNWGGQVGSLLVFFVLARLLEPEDFGLVALANVFLAFVQVFLDQGFPKALIQHQNLEPEHIHTAFWTNLISGAVLTGLCILFSPLIADLFNEAQLTPILRYFSLLLLISSFTGVQEALLERQFKFKFVALRSLLGLFLGGLAGVSAALLGCGVWSLVIQQLTYESVGAIVLWRASDWRPQRQFSWPHFRELFSFGVNILAFNFLGFINTRSDDLLIGYFLGPTALGYYSIAYRILQIMVQLLIDTVNRVALPTFSRLLSDLAVFRSAFYKATQLTSVISFPCFLAVAVLAPELITLLFGKQWLPSAPVLQLLALAGIFRTISRFKGAIFMAMGKPVWRVWLGLLSSILNLIFFAIAVRWGVVAVGLAYLVRTGIMFPIEQSAVGRLIQAPMRDYLRQFVAPLVSATLMAVAILVAQQSISWKISPILQLIVLNSIGAATYLILLRLLAPKLFQKLLAALVTFLPNVNYKNV
ncbi:lipopolysaccharide biosynthesis protein [Almyronema epifaneia]|uniref:Lipopolysaccharide biosynthesis protein n=1 Tax=Almyronema epifaneia S1 TaxID=2991925 RepID=A0ABW6I924_9CYAN